MVQAASAIAALGVASAAQAQTRWETVANSATIIPGTDQTFSSFNQPSINNDCLVTFRARGKGPETPPRGVYWRYGPGCAKGAWYPLSKLAGTGDVVPQPNNTDAVFNEFPSFSRVDAYSGLMATRAQTRPIWRYVLPDGSETRVGTAGIYFGIPGKSMPRTAMTLLGAVPAFSYFEVPGFPGVRFDQFPGAAAPFDGRAVAFKGNFTDGDTGRTGVYFRDTSVARAPVVKIADTTTPIPNGTVNFGSTAPPSAARGKVVFLGVDNEEFPTQGGIFLSNRTDPTALQSLVAIGSQVPGAGAGTVFNRFGEGLSYDGIYTAFWGAWGNATRTVKLYCPVDGNADLIAACIQQCPLVDDGGHYCERDVPVQQGIFVRYPSGAMRRIAVSGRTAQFKDFLFWVFSGRPPGTGGSEEEAEEPPRWRSSAFVAESPNGNAPAVAFKGMTNAGETGIFLRTRPNQPIVPVLLEGDDIAQVDSAGPAGSKVSAVGIERDGLRRCRMVLSVSFLNEVTSESWAGAYLDPNACVR